MTDSKIAFHKSFASIYNDVEKYPAIASVAAAIGKADSTVRHIAAEIRQNKSQHPDCPKLISRVEATMPFQHRQGVVPMSEDEAKFKEHFTAEDCIEELRRIALAHPDQVISRNFFRVHSDISESTWSRYFGVFEEYKRQAGIKLTRQQHAIERHIAKHASVDHYRRMNVDRRDYDDLYTRSTNSRFKTRIVCSDLHDEEMDPFFRRVLVDAVRRIQPDSFTIGGDGLDLPEFGKYGVDPRDWGPTRRIKYFHGFLQDVRNVYQGQIDHLEGNHEFRLLRHLSDETPALKVVLSELHGLDIRSLLGLDKFEVNYIAKADLSAWRERDIQKEVSKNYVVYDNCFMVHHFPEGRAMGIPGVNGHHHKHISFPSFSPIFGAFEWHQLGCGHARDASYCAGEKWHMGFMIAHIDTHTKQVTNEYIQITDMAVVGGKYYHREENEGMPFKSLA